MKRDMRFWIIGILGLLLCLTAKAAPESPLNIIPPRRVAIWPFRHAEQGAVHVAQNGRAEAIFKKKFSVPPELIHCTGTSRQKLEVRMTAHSRQWVEFAGTPGDVIDWSCKL